MGNQGRAPHLRFRRSKPQRGGEPDHDLFHNGRVRLSLQDRPFNQHPQGSIVLKDSAQRIIHSRPVFPVDPSRVPDWGHGFNVRQFRVKDPEDAAGGALDVKSAGA